MIQMPERNVPRERAGSLAHAANPNSSSTETLCALDHRARNNYAALLALVELTRNATETVDDFAAAMRGYIHAVATSHDLLSRSAFRSVELRELIEALTGPSQRASLNLEGPDIRIASRQAVAFALILQQLLGGAPHIRRSRLTQLHWEMIEVSERRLRMACENCNDISQAAMSLIEGLIRSELRGKVRTPDPLSFDVQLDRAEF